MKNQIARIVRDAGAARAAVSFYDYETETAWSCQGDRWFHAASTIKVAVLAAVFAAVEDGQLALDSRVHVRNRFLSAADGEPYRILAGRDANSEVHAAIGKTLRVKELAHHMIVTSSNLATNLLLDLVGIEKAKRTLAALGVEGVMLRRGVEDDKAYERDINNLVTANGLVQLFRLLYEERVVSPEASRRMIDVLSQQEFNGGLPSGLPAEVRAAAQVAHKTGEISTITHDAGLVLLPRRKPYVVAILTEWSSENFGRKETVARLSRAVYDHLLESGEAEAR